MSRTGQRPVSGLTAEPLRLAAAFMACAAICGCGTMQNLQQNPTPFGGVREEVRYIRHGDGLVEDLVGRPLAVVDLPFTMIGDTLTLPVTVPSAINSTIRERQDREWWDCK